MKTSPWTFAVAGAFLATVGSLTGVAVLTAGQPSPVERVWPAAAAPPQLRPEISRADVVIVEIHSGLRSALEAKLAKVSPELALFTCHTSAADLSRRIARRDGISSGLTSDRLRNAHNAPPDWTSSLVTAYAGRRAASVDGFVVDLGDRVGVLRPMIQDAVCARCHGPAERLDPAVRDTLGRLYPEDRAIGFRRGEIRGWYWVEVPKPREQRGTGGN